MLKSAVALAFIASISTANAQEPAKAPNCLPVNELISTAQSQYKEMPFLIGKLQKDGYFLLILSAADGSSWTIVSVGPDEMACLVETGTGLRPIKLPSGVPDRDA